MPSSQDPVRGRVRETPRASDIGWAVVSSLLLAGGFLGYVYLASRVAQRNLDSDSVQTMQTAFVIYARTVLVKGLLPQLLLSLGLFRVLDFFFSIRGRGRTRLILGLVVSALVAAVIIAPTLMVANFPHLPAVKFRDTTNFVVTCLEMTAAVSAATIVSKVWLERWPATGLPSPRPLI